MSENKMEQLLKVNESIPASCGCYLGMFGCECHGCDPVQQPRLKVTPPSKSGLNFLELVDKANAIGYEHLNEDEKDDFVIGMYGFLVVMDAFYSKMKEEPS